MITIYRNRGEIVGYIHKKYLDAIEIELPYKYDVISKRIYIEGLLAIPIGAMFDKYMYKPLGCIDYLAILDINSSLRGYVHLSEQYKEVDAIFDPENMITYRIMEEV